MDHYTEDPKQEEKYLETDDLNKTKEGKEKEKEKEKEKGRDKDRDREKSSRHSSKREKRNHHSRRDRSRSRDRHASRHSSRSRTRDRSHSRRRRHRSRSRSSKYDRSRSPKRERSVTPLHLKKRKLNNWDVPPPGYEGMTVAEVKATGLFPLGVQAPKVTDLVANTPVSQIRNILNTDQTKRFAMATKNKPNIRQMNQNPMNLNQDKKLYVGNIPFGFSEKGLIDFFNSKMVEYHITNGPGDSVVGAQIEKNYAFIEFRDTEETNKAMNLDGLISCGGQILKIRRPKNYHPPEGQIDPQPTIHSPMLNNVSDSPYKIFIGGLPDHLTDENVIEILKSFGPLKAFNLVKDKATGISRGYAFCEYMNPNITDTVCQGLNNLDIGGKKLIVQRASVGANKVVHPPSSFPNAYQLMNGKIEPTKILLLLNMVTQEELLNDETYEEIKEDVKNECQKFGNILSMKIPRPSDNKELSNVGKIYIEYESIDQSMVAYKTLAGRKFSDRTVVTAYYSEMQYLADDI